MTVVDSAQATAKAHPTGTFAGVSGVLMGILTTTFGFSSKTAGSIMAGLGTVSMAIAYITSHGGVRGVWQSFWGQKGEG